MAAKLDVSGRDGLVIIEPHGDVSETFWLTLRTQWDSTGPAPAVRLEVAAEQFLAKRLVLRELCKDYGVGLAIDDQVRGMLDVAKADRRALNEALARSDDISDAEIEARLAESGFLRDLKRFQTRDVKRLLSLPNGANFSVPGAGKTASELAVYAAERKAGRVEQLLVAAPLSAFGSWREEAEASMDPVPEIHRYEIGERIPATAEVVLINYQRLVTAYDAIAQWVASAPTGVVLDEAHRMKRGWEGEWGQACLRLAYLARRRSVLTGTPAPNHPRDLQALLDFLWPNQALRLLPVGATDASPPPDIGHQIGERIRPLYARTTKNELDLPPIEHRVHRVELTGLQRDIYLALKNEWHRQLRLSQRERVDLARMGQIVMYLLEAATNPTLLSAGSSAIDPEEYQHPPLPIPPGSPMRELIENYNRYETPAKFLVLDQLLKANVEDGRKTLVWSNFVRNLLILERRYHAYGPAVIHGGVPSAPEAPEGLRTREAEIERFRNDLNSMLLLANPAAMAEGISLHHWCHDAIYLDRTFNAGQYLQSQDRIHRLGLPDDLITRITLLVTADTIDYAVDDRVRTKAENLAAMLNDPDLLTFALPNETDYGPAIDANDFAALLAHLSGDDE
jgi:SNF2 family DNA or RNA helicase